MLTVTSKYALRALVHLAREPQGSRLLGRKLAERADIPANFLAKILLTLRNAGLVAATRGLGGGYRLARPAAEIRLVQVVELFEGASVRRAECFLEDRHACSDAHGCSAHPAWKHVKEVYLDFLNTQTIASIGASGTLTPLDPEFNRSKRPKRR